MNSTKSNVPLVSMTNYRKTTMCNKATQLILHYTLSHKTIKNGKNKAMNGRKREEELTLIN